MSTFDRLLPDHEKDAFIQAAERRISTRMFREPVSSGDYAALAFLAGRFERESVRLVLRRVPESFFTGGIMGRGHLQGCSCICLVCAAPSDLTLAGFCGEAYVLSVTQLNLATCWVTGGYAKKQADALCPSGLHALAVIALGHAPLSDGVSRRRRELRRLCRSDPEVWPEMFRNAAHLVQIAPSSGNSQPFLMDCRPDAFLLDSSDRTRLDLGIGICHASLAFRGPLQWVFSDRRSDPMATCLLGSENA